MREQEDPHLHSTCSSPFWAPVHIYLGGSSSVSDTFVCLYHPPKQQKETRRSRMKSWNNWVCLVTYFFNYCLPGIFFCPKVFVCSGSNFPKALKLPDGLNQWFVVSHASTLSFLPVSFLKLPHKKRSNKSPFQSYAICDIKIFGNLIGGSLGTLRSRRSNRTFFYSSVTLRSRRWTNSQYDASDATLATLAPASYCEPGFKLH